MSILYISPSTQENNPTVFGKPEEDIMNTLADGVIWRLQQHPDLTIYRNRPEMTLAQVIADSNDKKPDLHLALHSNAGGGMGTETWAWPAGTKSYAFACLLQQKVVNALGLPDRGVKDGRKAEYAEIYSSKYPYVQATSVLIEIFFHDSDFDAERYRERFEEVRDAIAEAVAEWFKLKVDPVEDELKRLRQFKVEVLEAVKRLEE